MEKVLLIMPESATHTTFYKKAKFHFPFSVWYLGTYWKSLGKDVTLMDYNVSNNVRYSNYDTVGISCITAQVPRVRQLIDFYGKSKIVLGGVHPTLYPEQTKEYGVEIVKGHAIKDFPNMPMLDYSLLDKDMMARKDKNFVGLVTSIGCPYKCTFCVNSIVKDYNTWQAWSARRICDEIEKAQSYGFKNVFFWDDNFFVDRNRVYDFIKCVSDRKLKMEWFALTRADSVDRKLFKECKRIGLRRVSIGAESGCDNVLKKLRKGVTIAQIKSSARICDSLGIEASYSYMIGLPDEQPNEIRATVKHIREMGKILDYPKIVGPMLYCPYPGSELYNRCKEYGWKQPDSFAEWNNSTTGNVDSPYSLPWVKHKDMTQIYWFYSFLIPISYRKITRLFLLYLKRTNRGWLWSTSLPLLLALATLGKVRHYLRWYRFPIETYLLKKFRSIIGA